MSTSRTKSVLITGAGARVGQHLALGLARDGWAVALHYNRSKDGAYAAAELIRKNSGRAICVQANLNVPQERNSLIKRTAEALGMPLTALINNASTFSPDAITDMSDASFDHHMIANLRAPLRLIQDFAKQYPSSETSGCVINMIDQRVLKPNPEFLTYTLSKASLHWATKTLAQALAPSIRINAIGPGPTLQNQRQTEADFAAEVDNSLLGTGSSPDSLLEYRFYRPLVFRGI